MDVPLLATFLVGPSLQEAPPAVQEHFQRLLADHLVQAFYRKIQRSAAATFDVASETPAANGIVAVTTVIRTPGSPLESITWRLKQANGTYKVVDVVSGGLSFMTMERAGFASVMGEGGLPKLIVLLEARSQAFRAEAGSPPAQRPATQSNASLSAESGGPDHG